MSFKRAHTTEYYLRDTLIENVFINEYMIGAPGDYVKVYLFALMHADIDVSLTNSGIAKQLNMDLEDVLKAWTYWESMGVVRKYFEQPDDPLRYSVEFQHLKSMIYGKHGGKDARSASRGKNPLDDVQLRKLYQEVEHITGRPLSGDDLQEILSWITDYSAEADAITYAFRFAAARRRSQSVKYVGKIIKEWIGQGLYTTDAIKTYIEENDNRHYLYKRVMKALGMTRNATEEEQHLMDKWFDTWGFDLETTLEACKKTSGISNPNFRYLNSVMRSWYKERTGKDVEEGGNGKSDKKQKIADVHKQYAAQRQKAEEEAEARRKEVYTRIPEIKKLEEAMRDCSMEISRIMLSGADDAKDKAAAMRKKADQMQAEKAFLMTENNFRIDYMDIVYACPRCKDTGILDNGDQCICFAKKLEEMQISTE